MSHNKIIPIAVQQQVPGTNFEREFALSLGPISLGLVRAVVRLVPDAAEAREYLREIRSVKLAVYRVEDFPPDTSLKMPPQLETLVAEKGWEVAAKVNQGDEAVWLIYRLQGDTIRDLYIVALGDDELLLVRAHGNIDQLLAKAMREHVAPTASVGIANF
jgi:hypothetical protein